MFTVPSFFPFISMIEPEEAGGGNEQEDNSEAFVDDGLGVPFEMPGEENQEPNDSEVAGVNPAWNDVINYIPEEERPKVISKLQEWDNNFAKVQSDFAPYKPLLDHKVSMEEVSRAFQFAQLVNTNPRAVYDELGQRFGFGQGQQQVTKEDDNEEEENPNPQFDLTKHPQFVEMQNKLQQFEQAAMLDYQRQQERQEAQKVESEFSNIENEFKVKLSPQAREEVLIRTVKIGDRTGNYDIREGYKDYSSFVNQIRNSRATNTAPKVFSGSGGLPANSKPLSQLNDEDRANRIVAWLEANNKEQ